jgi:hypothetical protein
MTAPLVRFYFEYDLPPEEDGTNSKVFVDVSKETADEQELFLASKHIKYLRIDL